METDHEIFSMVILSLPLIQEGQCQLLAKECANVIRDDKMLTDDGRQQMQDDWPIKIAHIVSLAYQNSSGELNTQSYN